MRVIEIKSTQAANYKIFFLSGLQNDAENFRISPHDEITAPFPTKDRDDSFTLGAYNPEGMLMGVVSFARDGDEREKIRHKGVLFRMYVDPSYRGQGAARALIEAILVRAEKLENMEQVLLTVVSQNEIAKNLYRKFGFQKFATEPSALKWMGNYFSEDAMVLFLKASDRLSNLR